MAQLDLVCVGDFYSDFIFYGLKRVPRFGQEVKTECFLRSPGGGAAITALTASRLGLNVGLVTIVGKETRNSDLAVLQAAGVDTSRCFTHPTRATGVTVAASTARDRFLLTYPGANQDLDKLLPSGVFSYIARARHLHLALRPQDFSLWTLLVQRLGARRITASWDPGWNSGLANKRGVAALLKALRILLVNEAEGRHWTGCWTPQAVLAALSRRVWLPVLKLGPRGSAALQRREGATEATGEMVMVQAPRVKSLETTGAGDAFNAGFLSAYLRGATLQQCLRSGNEAGARRAAGGGRR